MKLIYTPRAGFAAPPNGWPAADHEESGNAVAKAKLGSGFYRSETKTEQHISDKVAAVSKKAANRKSDEVTQSVIDEAESNVQQATDRASAVRRNLGKEK